MGEELRLSDLGVIRDLLSRHGFTFSKSLGQNFLVNPSVCPRIAEMGGAVGAFALEIGTGVGVLTAELARRAKKVVAVEIDARLLPVLQETLAEFDNVEVVNADVLELDLAALLREKADGLPVAVCANLPYYITSPILMHLLEARLPVDSITVMVQKEAAQRICAPPGSREAGAISLAVRYYAEPKRLFTVSRGSFYPAPNVDSAVIRLDVRKTPAVRVADEKTLFALIRAAFSQRRKMMANPVSELWGLPKAEVRTLMQRAGIPPGARAEQLTLEQFAALSDAYTAEQKR